MDPTHTISDDTPTAPVVTVTIGGTVVLSVGPDGGFGRQLPLAETAAVTYLPVPQQPPAQGLPLVAQ